MNQSEHAKAMATCSRRQARENARVQVTIGFGFASDWLRNWREFCQPITAQSNGKPMQSKPKLLSTLN